MAPIDVAKLGVDRQDDTVRVDLRHADETRIGKISAVPPDDSPDGRDLVVQAEGRRHDAPGHQLQDRLWAAMQVSNQVGGLRKNGLAGEKWRRQAAELVNRPRVIAVAAIQKGDEGPCVDDDRPQRP
jgi:hypothetical protein